MVELKLCSSQSIWYIFSMIIGTFDKNSKKLIFKLVFGDRVSPYRHLSWTTFYIFSMLNSTCVILNIYTLYQSTFNISTLVSVKLYFRQSSDGVSERQEIAASESNFLVRFFGYCSIIWMFDVLSTRCSS